MSVMQSRDYEGFEHEVGFLSDRYHDGKIDFHDAVRLFGILQDDYYMNFDAGSADWWEISYLFDKYFPRNS